jgi:hypothetical protein
MAKHGNANILYLLDALTSCHMAQSVNIYDRCKARYEGLSTRWHYSLRPTSFAGLSSRSPT